MQVLDTQLDAATIRLTAAELLALCSALNETASMMEDWELETRTGFDRETLGELHVALRDVLSDVVPVGE